MMKSYWTVRYVFLRFFEWLYRRTHPGWPWLTHQTNYFLYNYLKKSDVGFEVGSGFSTLWLAERVNHISSVEGNPFWYKKMQRLIKKKKLSNINYIFVNEVAFSKDQLREKYIQICHSFKKNSLDFALVDGLDRELFAKSVMELIKPGGLLIVDDVNWFIPSDTGAPGSRTSEQGFLNEGWEVFHRAVRGWRVLWTSNGIKDTALYFKPAYFDEVAIADHV